ncbi:hypothetical protein NXX53_06645 [Bacteroides salyersiae]|uniref:hypothetical protein n=1 Tax=Bacteroides sp. TaxID=29523 RepID=UPI0025BDD8D6|nr:hypothetical protein [Bacteroides sp.]MCS2956955.1 hypothetical protein [Bacteroides salyersiae]
MSTKIKIGDIVKAKFGAVVFSGNGGNFNILPHGVVTDIVPNENDNTKTIKVKIVFQQADEIPYKEEDLEVISSTHLVKPSTT